MRAFAILALLLAPALSAGPSLAQSGPPDPVALQAAQREAMKKLAFMDGEWRGNAWNISFTGEKHELIQTERVGLFLGGAVRVIEGRGHGKSDAEGFNALGVISYTPHTKAFSLRSYAMGMSGDYPLTPTDDGFRWEIKAGPMTMKYTATVKDGVWHEVGYRAMGEAEPAKFFEMTLKRIGDSTWPAAGGVPRGE